MSGDAAALESTVEIITPENIAFEYRVAGPFHRLYAFLIDLVLRVAMLMLVAITLSVLASLSTGLWLAALVLVWFLLEWFYGGVFETYMNGQTPGKRVMGIRVLTTDGRPINGLQAVLRNILRSADSLPWLSLAALGGPPVQALPTFAVGLFAMALNRRFQRLGDIVCGTMVVVEERNWYTGTVRINDPQVAELASQLPADLQVSRAGARALATYVERRRVFAPARREEIASQLADVYIDRLRLPPNTSRDLLLCAIYYRLFVEGSAPSSEPANWLSEPMERLAAVSTGSAAPIAATIVEGDSPSP